MALYTDTVMDHFMHPRNVGEHRRTPTASVEVGNAKCGDIMKMYLKIKDGEIEDVKFETFGCGSAIASTSMATGDDQGQDHRRGPRPSPTRQVVEALGGLPAHKLHCSVLAEEAVKSAVKDYYDTQRHRLRPEQSSPMTAASCESCRMV